MEKEVRGVCVDVFPVDGGVLVEEDVGVYVRGATKNLWSELGLFDNVEFHFTFDGVGHTKDTTMCFHFGPGCVFLPVEYSRFDRVAVVEL